MLPTRDARLTAAAELGLPVPEKLALVSVGDTVVGRFANPPLTGLNPNLPEHLHQAFDLLRRNQERRFGPELLRIVEPALVERRSTRRSRETTGTVFPQTYSLNDLSKQKGFSQ